MIFNKLITKILGVLQEMNEQISYSKFYHSVPVFAYSLTKTLFIKNTGIQLKTEFNSELKKHANLSGTLDYIVFTEVYSPKNRR